MDSIFSKSADQVIVEARQRINNLLRVFNEQKECERIQEAGGYDAAAAFSPTRSPVARPQSQRGRPAPVSGGSSPLSTYSGLPGSPLSYMASPQSSRGRSPCSSPMSTYSQLPGSPMSYMSSAAGSPMSTYSQLPGSPMSYMSSRPESPMSTYSKLPGSPLSYMTSPEASPVYQPFPRSPLTASPPPSPYSSPTASPYSSAASPASARSSPGGYATGGSPGSPRSAPGGYPGWDVLNTPDKMERMVEETKRAIAAFRERLDEIYLIAKVQPGYTQDAFMETIYESLPFDNPWPYCTP